MIDAYDRRILEELEYDGRAAFSAIANTLRISNTMVHQRINKMMDNGVITHIKPVINEKKIGYDLGSFTGITLENDYNSDTVIQELKKIPEITECHYIAGGYTLFLRIFARNSEHLRHILYDNIDKIEGVNKTESMIDLGCAFKRNVAPVPQKN
ncbi:MAG: Lrp/AsnC family transcriptional regulator [Saprospiraceae bacterium]